jgi:hypothetical protein
MRGSTHPRNFELIFVANILIFLRLIFRLLWRAQRSVGHIEELSMNMSHGETEASKRWSERAVLCGIITEADDGRVRC